jgi:protein TonB
MDRDVALTTRPRPVYPAQALRTREQGTVLVLAHVDANGQVSDARVVRRSGSSTLDRAAPNEVRRWKFSPALHDGQPIVASVEVPVSYRLEP